jgi:hypothetical protein
MRAANEKKKKRKATNPAVMTAAHARISTRIKGVHARTLVAVTGDRGATVAPGLTHECVTDNCEFSCGAAAVRSGRHEPSDQPRPEANGAEAQSTTQNRLSHFFRAPSRTAVYARPARTRRGQRYRRIHAESKVPAPPAPPMPPNDNIPNVLQCVFAPRLSSSGV